MTKSHRAAIAVFALLLGLSPATAAAGDRDDGDRDRRPTATLSALERPADRALRAAYDRDGEDLGSFVGLDGLVHPQSPVPVAGQGGYWFIGADFDTACAFGDELDGALHRLSRLADILERAGKRVVFTVSPNKTAVLRSRLPESLPQGRCSQHGLKLQSRLLDGYRDPRYLPLRAALARLPRSYWKTDTHWNTVGSSVFAQTLAQALDPRLARQQSYRRVARTHRGDLSYYVPGLGAETARGRVPDNGVRTRPVHGSPAFDPTLESVYTDLSWSSGPARKTYPGRTLVLGDSFTYVASEAVTNLFRHGRFMWVGFQQSMEEISAAVNRADTVVFSVVQRFAPITPLGDREFQDQLRAQLHR